ncbi:MAG: hypothetical protein OXD37_10505 [Acidimicrobiaceae bacterium]|nr:hypothetical protein [Acidimicrobiaceae bacterium]MCY4279414.1 hypothetical protein [Acidimicrobiaceae bacterium]MCY4294108.1 hypothetical protein [Acidimicrobiaceae bacterium]
MLSVVVIVGALSAVAGAPAAAVAGAAASAGLALAAVLYLRSPGSALRSVGAKPLAAGDHPRLENLIDGLCTTHAFGRPSLHVVESPALNAAALGLNHASAHLVLTTGALSDYGRLELEAVVARQLCAIRRGTAFATVLAGVSRLSIVEPLTARLAGRAGDFNAGCEIDVEAARLTSFPPAMSAALRQAADSATLETPRSAGHIWMVNPHQQASAEGAPSTLQRIDVLSEI